MVYDVVIIGGGPAGITAGIYSARKKNKTLMITKDFMGQAGKAAFVENWPGIKTISGLDLINSFKEHLKEYQIDFLENESVVSLKKKENLFVLSTDKKKEIFSQSVIVASGKNPRPLKVPGEKEYLGRGVVYCAICDGPLFSGKEIAVIGCGNSGFETALEMSEKYSCKVYLLEASLRIMADEYLQERAALNDKIEVIKGARLKEIKGDKFVESIVYQDIKEEKEKTIKVQGVFVEIGSVPVVDFLENLADCNEKGEVEINHRTCETKSKGLFAAGDVTDIRDKQIITASGEGAKAALSAYYYLTEIKNGKN
jgi:NADH-dependent peroxiredoxin subunit F